MTKTPFDFAQGKQLPNHIGKPFLLREIKPLLAVAILLAGLGLSCGSSETSEDNLVAPDFIRPGAPGTMIVGEKALGKIWTISTEDYKIPKTVGPDGKKARLPRITLDGSILEMKAGPDGGALVTLSEGDGVFVLRSYETQGFSEQGRLELPERPLDFEVGNGGLLYLLEEDPAAGGGRLAELPASLVYAGAKTLTVVPTPVGLELAPDAGHLLVEYGPGEARFGWLGLADFNQVADLPWTPELTGVGKYRAVFFTDQAYPGGAVMVVPEGGKVAYRYSLDQSLPAARVDLHGLTGDLVGGGISGEPVLIWITLAGYLMLFDFSSGCFGSLGVDASSAGEAAFADVGPISNPEIDKINTSDCLGVAKSETWTITYTGAGWQVEGSVSGLQANLAAEGEVYTTAGGELSFRISAAENPSSEGDSFTLETNDGITGVYFAAAAPELYLDEAEGEVWISDTSGGRVYVVNPLTGTTLKIIY